MLYTTSEHSRIKKGDSVLFRLEAYVTAPLADFELGIMQPMGYNVRGKQGEHIVRISIHSQVLRRMCFMLERSSTTWATPSPATATIS